VASVGDVIQGKYRLVRLLGDGGMGSVYEATHALLGTRVAIKVLHADLVRRTGLIDRFLQEARVAAQIKSPHVVQVTDVDRTQEGLAYIVMELLEGEPLSAMLDRQGKIDTLTSCDFTIQILDALEAAHALGVTHRDLKPENVFVTYPASKSVLKLIDFGIAKLRSNVPGERSLTVAGMLMGTAEYMAPEQAFSADKVDARSDLYAVGVMLYEMLAGKRPVHGSDAREIASKVDRGEVTPLVHAAPEVPREIAGLVHRAMAARPELRFGSATEMRLALEAAIATKRPLTTPVATQPGARATPLHTPADAPPRTERAPGPIGFSPAAPYVPTAPAHLSPGMTPSPVRSRRARSGGVWAIIVIPLLLGAGAVVTWVVTSQNAPSPAATATASATAPPAWTAPASATPPATPIAVGTVARLVPAQQGPSAPSRGAHPAHPSSAASSAASAPGEAPYTPPPFTMPSGFPFPTSADGGSPLLPFPVPAGFPTTLPSSLPFPFPLPETPPEQSSAPAPAKSI
jgi:eukaryotic-like serine/threonine-protein kinase